MSEKIKIAVIVGAHPYNVQAFQDVFTANEKFEAYVQSLEIFTCSSKEQRESYDVLVFYHMYMETPTPESAWNGIKTNALEQLGETNQGILVLHHALLAHPEWQPWSDICGIDNREFKYHIGETVDYQIKKIHPITEGVRDFTMTDETYTMNEPGSDSEILVATAHKPSMETILWTKKHKNSRVVCYESGHDAAAYNNENFRKLLYNSILWLAGKM